MVVSERTAVGLSLVMQKDKNNQKVCSGCKRQLPATTEYFHKQHDNCDGLMCRCKECRGIRFGSRKNYDDEINHTRQCAKCGVVYPLDKYHFDPGKRMPRGFDSVCKQCRGRKFGFRETSAPVNGYLTCKHCAKELPATTDFFYKANNRKGLNPVCIDCYNRPKKEKRGYLGPRSQSDKDGYKICTGCGDDLPATTEYFYRSSQGKHKLNGHCKKCIKRYHLAHRDDTNKRARECRNKNPEKYNNIQARLTRGMRGLIHRVLQRYRVKKKNRTIELLGCDIAFLVSYLESQFQPGMNWENYGHEPGCWQVDHIRPCASFDLRDIAQQKECFGYHNLQPLWATENYSKNSWYNGKRHFYRMA